MIDSNELQGGLLGRIMVERESISAPHCHIMKLLRTSESASGFDRYFPSQTDDCEV